MVVLILLSSAAVLFRPSILVGEILSALSRLFPLILIFSSSLLRTDNLEYALQKIDGAIFVTLISAAVAGVVVRIYGKEFFLKSFIAAALFILFLTVAYKLFFGFWDREVRYFINGPIVFGWLMSAAAISALVCFLREYQRKYIALYILFFCSVLWTISKGPIVSLVVVSVIVMLRFGNLSRKFGFLLGVTTSAYVLQEFIPSDKLTRLTSISRLILGGATSVDEGSLGTRQAMMSKTIEIIGDNTVFGVGLGNWQDHAGPLGTFVYPHNFLLEVFAETGVFPGVVLVALLVYLWVCCSKEGRAIALVFLVGALFSGDAGYLRLPLTFLIAFRTRRIARVGL